MKNLLLIVPAALLVFPAACVERKMFVRTDPPGAAVALNREAPIEGATPLELPFSYYGTYAVRLTREGYRALETSAEVDPPWWSWPPFDLITEFLIPFTIEDHREFSYTLEPLPPERTAEESRERNRKLVERGEALRSGEKSRGGGESR